MPLCTLEEIYQSPWGILKDRRGEIENSAFGGFNKILEEEIDSNFLSIERVAALMEVHISTARRWLKNNDPRYITRGKNVLYFKNDALFVIEERKKVKMSRSSKATAENE